MKFEFREYTIQNIEETIKSISFFLFCNGANKNAKSWLITEQNIKKMNFRSHKVFNSITRKRILKSIHRKVTPIINCAGFIFTTDLNEEIIIRNIINETQKSIKFAVLAVKLNNKFFSARETKSLLAYKYLDNNLLFFKLKTLSLKWEPKNFNACKSIHLT